MTFEQIGYGAISRRRRTSRPLGANTERPPASAYHARNRRPNWFLGSDGVAALVSRRPAASRIQRGPRQMWKHLKAHAPIHAHGKFIRHWHAITIADGLAAARAACRASVWSGTRLCPAIMASLEEASDDCRPITCKSICARGKPVHSNCLIGRGRLPRAAASPCPPSPFSRTS